MPSSDHYFSAAPASAENLRTITVPLVGRDRQVTTAGGVFSPDRLDTGTAVLFANMAPLPPSGNFLDLGCGVGNVVAQASLQTGCRSYGIECMETPARIASRMLPQFKARCRMWGVNVGEIELEHGDMLKSKRVDELIPQADVVLVNNKVFDDWRKSC